MRPAELWHWLRKGYLVYGALLEVDGASQEDLEALPPMKPRALFFPGKFHVPRSLARRLNKADFTVTFDTAFRQVVQACIRDLWGWITPGMIRLACEAFEEGWAHSCEVWLEGRLVGGVYGYGVGRVFFAESMFHREDDMGKIALLHLVAKCFDLGFEVVDGEEMKDSLALLGAVGCPNREFLELAGRWLDEPTAWSPLPKELRT
ncbi:MAG: leucyl/phenylalanyl-tRNA--protein transferase [Fimbriimonadales bacterium]